MKDDKQGERPSAYQFLTDRIVQQLQPHCTVEQIEELDKALVNNFVWALRFSQSRYGDDAADIAQDFVIEILVSFSRGELRFVDQLIEGHSNWKGMLHKFTRTVLRGVVSRRFSKERRSGELELDPADGSVADILSDLTDDEDRSEQRRLVDAIKRSSDPDLQMDLEARQNGWTAEDAAERNGLTPAAYKAKTHRARRRFRDGW